MNGGQANLSVADLTGLPLAAGIQVDYLDLAKWGGLALVGVVLIAVVMVAYRRLYRSGRGQRPGQIWTLEDLNALRRRGALTEDEYTRLRDRALGEIRISRPNGGWSGARNG